MSIKEAKPILRIVAIFSLLIIVLSFGLGMLLFQKKQTVNFLNVSLQSKSIISNLFEKILLVESSKSKFLSNNENANLIELYRSFNFKSNYYIPIINTIEELEVFFKSNKNKFDIKTQISLEKFIDKSISYKGGLSISTLNKFAYFSNKNTIEKKFDNFLKEIKIFNLNHQQVTNSNKKSLINNINITINIFIVIIIISIVIAIFIVRSLYFSIQKDKNIAILQQSMKIAEKIQTAALPDITENKKYDFAAWMQTADKIGGDYYDILPITDNLYWSLIGDVSGHGIDAGISMLFILAVIMGVIKYNPNCTPEDLLVAVNAAFVEFNKRLITKKFDTKYITLTVLKIENDILKYVGPHQDIMLYRNEKVQIFKTDELGVWPGFPQINDFPSKIKGKEKQIKLQPNDVILLYTDGITEAMHKEKDEQYCLGGEVNQLQNVFQENAHLQPKEIIETIKKSLENYDTDDDQTIVCFRVK